jgi:hypothetical protein
MTRFFRRPARGVATLSACALVFLAASRPAAADAVLSDNLTSASGGVETATGDTWLTAGFGTDGRDYDLTSITLLLQRASIGGQVELDVYDDDFLQPGSLVGSLTYSGTIGSSLSEVTFTTTGLSLAANSSYWVVLKAVTGEFAWSWANDSDGSGAGFQHTWGSTDDAGATWFTYDSYPLQMSVMATAVPEPGSLIPFALGAGAVLVHFRRRSTAPAAA